MSENLHKRAEQFVAKERVEGLADSEREWLAGHLGECPVCAEKARATDRALRSLRTAPVPVPADLVSRTQFRVRLRAMELREREPKHLVLWAMCALSWVFGVGSAPYVWRLFEWFGQHTGVPKLVLQLSFGLWWAIPALFVAIVLLMESAKREESDWLGQDW